MFDRVLNAHFILSPYMRIRISASSLFQRLGAYNPFQTSVPLTLKANQLTKNETDWCLYVGTMVLNGLKIKQNFTETHGETFVSGKAATIPENASKHYLFKVNNKNTRRGCKNMFKVNNNKETSMTCI